MRKHIFIFIITILISFGCQNGQPTEIIILPGEPDELSTLASKEVRRYLHQRCDASFEIIVSDDLRNASIIITSKDNLPDDYIDEDLAGKITRLGEQEYIVTTINNNNRNKVLICGGDQTGTLYGAYRYIETTGIRFYPHGDVIPD